MCKDEHQDDAGVARLVKGEKRLQILKDAKIPEVYHETARVKQLHNGTIHVYYGGVAGRNYSNADGHGHLIIGADGCVKYCRLPFEKHGRRNCSDYMPRKKRKSRRRQHK